MDAIAPTSQASGGQGKAWIGWLGALVVFAWGLAVLPGIGVGFDENVHATYGELVLKGYQTGGRDTRNVEYKDLMFYGPWVDALAAAFYGGEDGQRSYPLRHALALAFTALTLPAAFYLGRAATGGWPGGLAAMVAMALMPRYLGHGMFNTKDVPFACLFAWSLAWVWGIRGQLWRLGWREAVGLGGLAGLCMGVRVGGLLVFVILGAAAGIAWTRETMALGKLEAARVRETAVALGWWALAFGIAYTLMVSVWPWAWSSPFSRPMEAMDRFSSFRHQSWLAFDGKVVFSRNVPLTYLPVHLLLGTPVAWLALGALGAGAGLAACWRKPIAAEGRQDPRTEATVLGVLVWLVLPLIYVFLTRPTLYGAGRQFFFMAPAIAVAGGMGFGLLWRLFPKHQTRVLAIFGIGALWAGWGTFRLHPYEYTYYNEFAGPRATLPERFEMDDWALSYREAALWLNEQQARLPGRPLKIQVAANDYSMPCLLTFLDPRIHAEPLVYASYGRVDEASKFPRLPADVDYYVTFNDPNGFRMYPKTPIVHTVSSQGAALCLIRANTPYPVP